MSEIQDHTINNKQSVNNSRRSLPAILRFLFITAIICLIAVSIIAGFRQSRRAPVTQPGTAILPVQPIAKARTLIRYLVKRGDTFAGILEQFGVSRIMADTYYRSLQPLGLRALFPGDSLVLGVDSSGSVDTFQLLSRLQYRYHLTHRGADIAASRKPVAIAVYRCFVRGKLSRSLSEDMFDIGEGDGLVAKFADIFAWDIDFFTDPRVGDAFDIEFEKKYAEGRFIGYGDILAARYVSAGKTFSAIGFTDADGTLQYYDENGKSVQKQFLKAPLRFSRISSGFTFHRKDPIRGIVRPHLGIDYAAPAGTPVYSAADGHVQFAGAKGGFGNYIVISHGASYQTCYGHLLSFAPGLHTGKTVKQGDLIGRVGSTGYSTGPHLDYRMTQAGRNVNPQTIKLPSRTGIEDRDCDPFATVVENFRLLIQNRFTTNTFGSWVIDIRDETPTEARSPSIITEKSQVTNGNATGS
jgi:murein DD-endopeptidase MepM/ murein hydrolase activator NlpD